MFPRSPFTKIISPMSNMRTPFRCTTVVSKPTNNRQCQNVCVTMHACSLANIAMTTYSNVALESWASPKPFMSNIRCFIDLLNAVVYIAFEKVPRMVNTCPYGVSKVNTIESMCNLARNIWLNYEGRRPEFSQNGGYAAGFAEWLRAIACHFTADFVMLICCRLNF